MVAGVPGLLLAGALGLLATAAVLWRTERRWAGRIARVTGPQRRPKGARASEDDPLRLGAARGRTSLLARLLAGAGPPRAMLLASFGGPGGVALWRAFLLASAAVLLLLLLVGLDGARAALAAPLLVVLVSRLLSRRRAAREVQRFRSQLPDAIALMVRGLRAGIPISEAVADAGREFPDPLGAAFRGAFDEVRLGQPLEAALWEVARRVDLPEMNFLCVTISIQRETGGNLAETLGELESMLRKRAQLSLKVRALSSEARTSALIIGTLPVLMGAGLALMAPEYVAPLVDTGAGRVLLLTAVLCLGTGATVMTHLVRMQARG
jgi:tight adherence protein B